MNTKLSKSEYKKKLHQAISDSINFRWNKLKLDSKANVPDCQLCALNNEINNFEISYCSTCPGNYPDKECCGGYFIYDENPTPENAQVVIDYLENIDIDSWVQHLVELGIIE